MSSYVVTSTSSRPLPPSLLSLYDDGQGYVNSPEIACGQHLYSLLDRTIVLDQVMRQEGDDERSRLFRETLAELRDYGPDGISDGALQFLRSRVKTRLSREEVSRFDDALHLLFKKKDVQDRNVHGLAQMRAPVMPVNARHNVPAAARADEEEAEGLHPRVLLAKGAPIMLTSNVATHHGLVNGRHGHLHDIVWRPDADPHKDLPEYLLFVPSSAYSGPFLFHDDKGRSFQ
jgi:hypothetical protein